MQERNRFLSTRALVILLFCLAAFCAIAIRLFFLQVVQHEAYREKVARNLLQRTTLAADRGEILDRNG